MTGTYMMDDQMNEIRRLLGEFKEQIDHFRSHIAYEKFPEHVKAILYPKSVEDIHRSIESLDKDIRSAHVKCREKTVELKEQEHLLGRRDKEMTAKVKQVHQNEEMIEVQKTSLQSRADSISKMEAGITTSIQEGMRQMSNERTAFEKYKADSTKALDTRACTLRKAEDDFAVVKASTEELRASLAIREDKVEAAKERMMDWLTIQQSTNASQQTSARNELLQKARDIRDNVDTLKIVLEETKRQADDSMMRATSRLDDAKTLREESIEVLRNVVDVQVDVSEALADCKAHVDRAKLVCKEHAVVHGHYVSKSEALVASMCDDFIEGSTKIHNAIERMDSRALQRAPSSSSVMAETSSSALQRAPSSSSAMAETSSGTLQRAPSSNSAMAETSSGTLQRAPSSNSAMAKNIHGLTSPNKADRPAKRMASRLRREDSDEDTAGSVFTSMGLSGVPIRDSSLQFNSSAAASRPTATTAPARQQQQQQRKVPGRMTASDRRPEPSNLDRLARSSSTSLLSSHAEPSTEKDAPSASTVIADFMSQTQMPVDWPVTSQAKLVGIIASMSDPAATVRRIKNWANASDQRNNKIGPRCLLTMIRGRKSAFPNDENELPCNKCREKGEDCLYIGMDEEGDKTWKLHLRSPQGDTER